MCFCRGRCPQRIRQIFSAETADATTLALPLEDRTGPGQTAAEDHHQDIVAGFDSAAAIRFIERDRDRRSGSIPESVEIHEELVDGDFQAIRNRFDDAHVRLMRNNAGDIVNR